MVWRRVDIPEQTKIVPISSPLLFMSFSSMHIVGANAKTLAVVAPIIIRKCYKDKTQIN